MNEEDAVSLLLLGHELELIILNSLEEIKEVEKAMEAGKITEASFAGMDNYISMLERSLDQIKKIYGKMPKVPSAAKVVRQNE